MNRPGTIRPGTIRPGTIRPGTIRPGTIRPGTIRPGTIDSEHGSSSRQSGAGASVEIRWSPGAAYSAVEAS